MQIEIEGKQHLTAKAGDTFIIEAGRGHDAKNIDAGTSRVLAIYFVEKGKPLVSLVK
jgi:quercetin dioxygenase-like cupin family protein